MRKLSSIPLIAAIVFVLVSAMPAIADPAGDATCKDVGAFTNLTESSTGDGWSVVFDDTQPTLTLTVDEGWSVMLCVKAGSAEQGNGPEITGPYGEGEFVVGHSSEKELSHYGVIATETTTTTVEETTTTTAEETTTTTEAPTTTETVLPGVVTASTSTTSATLPFTGMSDVGELAVLGAALLGLGTVVVKVGQRREDRGG